MRVNAVSPGVVDTPMVAGLLADPGMRELLTGLHPMKRIGQPEEVAEAIAWLCSDSSSFATGQALSLDGGFLAQ